VLGTTFNVKAYTQDPTAEATLITGSVEVRLNDGLERRVRLLPNQKIVLQHPDSALGNSQPGLVAGYRVEGIRGRQDNRITETAWRNNYLVFDNDNFENIALKMERWYGISVHLNGKKLKGYHFTGTFQNEPFTEVLDALKVTTSFHCRITGNEVFITE
jgi:ferric-dicitrate binding protein FerR (iron transport regulator)